MGNSFDCNLIAGDRDTIVHMLRQHIYRDMCKRCSYHFITNEMRPKWNSNVMENESQDYSVIFKSP